MNYIKQGNKIYKIIEETDKEATKKIIKDALDRIDEEEKTKLAEVKSFFQTKREQLQSEQEELNNF